LVEIRNKVLQQVADLVLRCQVHQAELADHWDLGRGCSPCSLLTGKLTPQQRRQADRTTRQTLPGFPLSCDFYYVLVISGVFLTALYRALSVVSPHSTHFTPVPEEIVVIYKSTPLADTVLPGVGLVRLSRPVDRGVVVTVIVVLDLGSCAPGEHVEERVQFGLGLSRHKADDKLLKIFRQFSHDVHLSTQEAGSQRFGTDLGRSWGKQAYGGRWNLFEHGERRSECPQKSE
jgi:hypothetical protein